MKLVPAKKPMKLQPPIIPVIDVVFNLIIFFMLTPSVSGSDGFLTTNLPTDVGTHDKRGPIILKMHIHLDDVGPQGEFVPGQPNAFCSIRLEDRPLGGDFGALGVLLKEKRAHGLAADTPVVIHPTTSCRHKWVVQAFDTIAAAGFTQIEFAVPYDD